LKESEVRNAIKDYLRDNKYYVPEKEFNIGVRPDVVGFQWIDNFEIKSIAVECKTFVSSRLLIETALNQAREYQLAFPYVYLATPNLKNHRELEGVFRSLRIGLFMVDGAKAKEIFKADISPRLDYDDFLFKVRQVAAAILTYREVIGEPDVNIPYPGEVHCYIKEESANFLLSNYPKDRNYYFGICVEKKENVRKLERVSKDNFYKLIQALPEEYLIRLDYVDTYKPREVCWLVMGTRVQELSSEDIEGLLDYCKKKEWRTRFILWRKVWEEDEALSKREHKRRLEKVIEELTPIKELIG